MKKSIYPIFVHFLQILYCISIYKTFAFTFLYVFEINLQQISIV